jgi:hypothetical protein
MIADTCTECALPVHFHDDSLNPDGVCFQCRLDLDAEGAAQ